MDVDAVLDPERAGQVVELVGVRGEVLRRGPGEHEPCPPRGIEAREHLDREVRCLQRPQACGEQQGGRTVEIWALRRVEHRRVDAGTHHGHPGGGDLVPLAHGAGLGLGDGDDEVGLLSGEALPGDPAPGLGGLARTEGRGITRCRDGMEGLDNRDAVLAGDRQGRDAAEPVVGVHHVVVVVVGGQVRTEGDLEGRHGLLHVALGQGARRAGVEADQPNPCGDILHGGLGGAGAAGEEVDAVPEAGQSTSLLEDDDVHPSGIGAPGTGQGRGVRRDRRDVQGRR